MQNHLFATLLQKPFIYLSLKLLVAAIYVDFLSWIE